jgi:hypothetical protein
MGVICMMLPSADVRFRRTAATSPPHERDGAFHLEMRHIIRCRRDAPTGFACASVCGSRDEPCIARDLGCLKATVIHRPNDIVGRRGGIEWE